MSGEKADITKFDLIALDYHGKVKALETVAQEMIDVQVEYVQLSGRMAEIKAKLELLKQVKSSLQSSIRAEGVY